MGEGLVKGGYNIIVMRMRNTGQPTFACPEDGGFIDLCSIRMACHTSAKLNIHSKSLVCILLYCKYILARCLVHLSDA